MKSIIRIAGVVFMFMITVNFYIILFTAMSNDGAVAVYFNHFGEGLLEYIVYIALMPIILVSFVLNLKTYKRRKEEIKNDKSRRHSKDGSRDYKTSTQDGP